MDKSAIRKQLRIKRQNLTDKEAKELSLQIINNCVAIIDWSAIQSAHIYLPLSKNNEVDSLPLINAARQINPEAKIASTDPVAKNVKTRWLDPRLNSQKVVPAHFQFGLIIVPMLGFDRAGYRLGFGGGFYDQFLANQLHALTIGLCYEFGKIAELPREDHDIPLKIIVTEKSVYKF